MKHEKVIKIMEQAQEYADSQSMCRKVAVGSAICLNDSDRTIVFGANTTMPESCKEVGCLREELYGEDSKNHRLPSDCRAIHSEIDAISNAARFGLSTKGAGIVVTRYPCESCARAIVKAGISKVYYGRNQEISELTKEIFKKGNVQVYWKKEFAYEDTTR